MQQYTTEQPSLLTLEATNEANQEGQQQTRHPWLREIMAQLEQLEEQDAEGPEEEEQEVAVPREGIVESIELINIRNHAHLEVKFSPTINFIVGHNGSK